MEARLGEGCLAIPETMAAVCLTGYGGLEKLAYREDVAVPQPGPGAVLVQVAAAGMNNTDINTRTGWYSKAVESGTTAEGGRSGFAEAEVKETGSGMGDWSVDIRFPRIQGADVVGRVVAVGDGVPESRLGERVVCDPYIRAPEDSEGLEAARFLGADLDGGFAQFTVVPSGNAVAVAEELAVTDAQLATLPCAGGTAMNMLLMAGIEAGDRVLVTGASGGVGTFLVQIAKHIGAEVTAVAGQNKAAAVAALGAEVVHREEPDLVAAALAASGGEAYSLVADVVGGPRFADYLALLRRGGRYVTAGAIAGPLVSLDLRTLYLKSLSFFGSTTYRRDTFPTLLSLVSEGGLTPAVASTRPLKEIREAQEAFMEKTHVGSLVLIPPAVAVYAL